MAHDFIPTLDLLVHRLTQPITALRGLLEVSLMGELNAANCRQTLEEALDQAERASEVLDQMKEIVESAAASGGLRHVSWAETLGQAVISLQPLAAARQVSVVMELQETTLVRANPERLSLATRQCLAMAIECSPMGGSVRINLGPSGNELVLSVRTEGENLEFPLPADAGEEPDVPMDKLKWDGLRRLMRVQGGEARVKKLSSREACFEMRLPQSRRAAQQQPPPEP
jgi:signal transduction histidine kinase